MPAKKHANTCACPNCFARVARGVENGKPSRFNDGLGTAYIWAIEETGEVEGKKQRRWVLRVGPGVSIKDVKEFIKDLQAMVLARGSN